MLGFNQLLTIMMDVMRNYQAGIIILASLGGYSFHIQMNVAKQHPCCLTTKYILRIDLLAFIYYHFKIVNECSKNKNKNKNFGRVYISWV